MESITSKTLYLRWYFYNIISHRMITAERSTDKWPWNSKPWSSRPRKVQEEILGISWKRIVFLCHRFIRRVLHTCCITPVRNLSLRISLGQGCRSFTLHSVLSFVLFECGTYIAHFILNEFYFILYLSNNVSEYERTIYFFLLKPAWKHEPFN